MTLVSELNVQPWCTKHRRMLSGMPRLSWDHRLQAWSYTLSDCTCPVTAVDTDCISTWACTVEMAPAVVSEDVCGWPRHMGGRCGGEPFYVTTDGVRICIDHAAGAHNAGATLKEIGT